MERPQLQHTRADYDDAESWARYLLESGWGPEEDGRGRHKPSSSSGPYGQLFNAIFGWEQGQAKPTRAGPSKTASVEAESFVAVYRAVAFANWNGIILNNHITVGWSTVGVVGDTAVAAANKKLCERLRKWQQRNVVTPAFIWVVERGKKHGLHLHILAHVPRHLKTRLLKWIKSAVAQISRRPLVETKESSTVMVRAEQEWKEPEQWVWFEYLMKGLDQSYEVQGLKQSDQGVITGKRVGAARALDETAQKRSDFPRSLANPKKHGVICDWRSRGGLKRLQSLDK